MKHANIWGEQHGQVSLAGQHIVRALVFMGGQDAKGVF
jgi:hypothetical protein